MVEVGPPVAIPVPGAGTTSVVIGVLVADEEVSDELFLPAKSQTAASAITITATIVHKVFLFM